MIPEPGPARRRPPSPTGETEVDDNYRNEDSHDPGLGEEYGAGATEGLLLPPWERRERFGFLNALYLTIKDTLLSPNTFFHRMPSRVGLAQPLLFAIVLGLVATFFHWMYTLAGSSLQVFVEDDLAEVIKAPIFSFFNFLFSPVLVTVGVFFQAGLTHLMLMILGGNRLGFEATFRVAAYSEATAVLLMIPGCGAFLALIWSLVVMVIGLYSIHEIEPWKAVLAIILPTVICLATIGSSVVALIAGLS
jgi:hypothetical protein